MIKPTEAARNRENVRFDLKREYAIKVRELNNGELQQRLADVASRQKSGYHHNLGHGLTCAEERDVLNEEMFRRGGAK